jgi:hypothetical protein
MILLEFASSFRRAFGHCEVGWFCDC